ncbi:hypothetical protein SEA_EMOTION_48 [Arthrobacter phage Emotion]|uniref:Uncharacterized protein n=1 Tax=Arthrobacter phage Emotion TaxID=3038361 RepID=A0AA49ERY0_9CAUD|nr:hypothetical protein SEA_EMOTION_48 [Arthrobacter phage Emotion]
MAELIPDVRDTAREYLLLSDLLLDASAIEYQAAPIPKPREDNDGGKALGGHGDPTGDIALDARRLAVREEAERARRLLGYHHAALVAQRKRLARALDAWNGASE